MKTRKIMYAIPIMVALGLMVSRGSFGNKLGVRSESYAEKGFKKEPRVFELDATKCPSYRTFVIKNEKERKVYGPKYARKENEKLKRV